ncbi:MAG: sulfur carrier protein ThiS [Egibacteraceae bacterium]
MRVVTNGREQPVREGTTVADLVAELGHDPGRPGVAVAVNGAVVPRRTWRARRLADGDRVEVLGAAQGG